MAWDGMAWQRNGMEWQRMAEKGMEWHEMTSYTNFKIRLNVRT